MVPDSLANLRIRQSDCGLEKALLPDKSSIFKALTVCCRETSLEKGKNLHAIAVSLGFDSDTTLATAILSLYGKCGILDDAFSIFYRLNDKDVVSWNAIISAGARHRWGSECLCLFEEMRQNSVLADKFTMVSILSACAALEDIKAGQYIHAQMASPNDRLEVILGTAFIRMYSKCKSIKHARRVFDELEYRDQIAWNTMISGYSELGHVEDAFRMFNQMLCEGMLPNTVTFITILDACVEVCDLQILHSWLLETGSKLDVILGSALLNKYCSYSCLCDAQKVFDSISARNLITWNSLIAGYKAVKKSKEALAMLRTMQDEGINPDKITWSTILEACADLEGLGIGECILDQVLVLGLEDENFIVASAIKFYSKFYCTDVARLLFRRVLCRDFLLWNTLIMVYAQHGLVGEACEFLHEMIESGVIPDRQMLTDLLGACAKHAALSEGRFLHSVAIFLDVDSDPFVANTIIDMYGNCTSLEDAWCLFERMKEDSGRLLTSIVGAYANSGDSAHAMCLYAELCRNEVLLDKAALLNLLNACSMQEYLNDGRKLHICVTVRGYDLDCVVANALIKMYGNCCALLDAETLFESLLIKDTFSWNIMITTYVQQYNLTEVFQCLFQMELEGNAPNEVTFVSILSGLTQKVTLSGMALIHDRIVGGGFESVQAIVAPLIHFYAKLGMMEDANWIFDKSCNQNVAVWNSIIKGLSEQGRATEALQLFVQMQNEGVLAEKTSYVCIFDAFKNDSSLYCGKHLHACMSGLGFFQDIVLNTALVSFYGRCCSLSDVCRVFSTIPKKDDVCWSALMQVLCENCHFDETLQLFEQMRKEAFIPSKTCLLNTIGACTESRASREGLTLHACLLNTPYISDMKITNAILNMYGESGSVDDAERNFMEMPEHDVISYNIMIKCYVHHHSFWEALQIFLQMAVEGITPDYVTLESVLEVCSYLGAYFQGKFVHLSVIFGGYSPMTLENAAISMYSKCGKLEQALGTFNHIPERNVASWNSIISAFCFWEFDLKAFEIFATMLWEAIPNIVTFVSLICICTKKGLLTDGKLLHFFVVSLEFENEVMVGNCLISMYGRCSCSSDAERVFEGLSTKTAATWNAMVTSGVLQEAANLSFIDDMQRDKMCPNEITYASVLDFCADNNYSIRGRFVHMKIILHGFELNINVVTSLVNFYSKCGLLMDARSVFQNASFRNLFTWTAMVAGYACCGLVEEALLLLQQMEHKKVPVDNVTLGSVLSSCACNGSLQIGQLMEAERMIRSMPFQPNAMSWTALVAACQTFGDVDMAHRAVAYVTELNGEYFETVPNMSTWPKDDKFL